MRSRVPRTPVAVLTAVVAALQILSSRGADRLRIGWSVDRETLVRAWGVDPEQQHTDFSENETLRVKLIETSIPANILWPGEEPALTFLFENLTDGALTLEGVFDIDRHGAFNTDESGLGKTGLKKLADVAEMPLRVDLPPGGHQRVTLTPRIPETFGGYLILVDVKGQGRFFGAGLARVRKVVLPRTLYRRYTMDAHCVDQMSRLAAYPNREGINWKRLTDADFEEWYGTDRHILNLRAYHEAGMTVTVEFGTAHRGNELMPLGRPRPHLDANDVMMQTKEDYAWLPQYDDAFEAFVCRLCRDYGYPKGPINGVMLWNEPWEGLSISGWGADLPRYREIYAAMARGTERARRDAGVDVLIGGCDSSSNTLDKLFPVDAEWLKWLDFMSIHYQSNSSNSTIKAFLERTHVKGRVLIWDT
ncbi:MAG: hypothetical protein JXR77_09870, partial [Lentisphaeria bacterium]|nr:hypothetical protein [Lentisphaeria bacterium]